MFKNILKKLVPVKLRSIYRLRGKFYYYRDRINQIRGRNDICILLGTPVHENMGDHIITCAEKMFLKSISNRQIVEIPIEAFKLYKQIIIKYVNSSIPIYIQGGGWMGTIWVEDELLVQDMIKSFPNNKIIVFPQTAYYEGYDSNIVDSGKKVYKGRNLYVFLRENRSFYTMKSIYPSLKAYIEPDIAMYLKGRITIPAFKENNIGICFRNDIENEYIELKNEIVKYLVKENAIFKYIDTISRSFVNESQRNEMIKKLLVEFSSYDLIITDRLHGMIISYIVGVPCIAIDNKTHKVFSVYDTWLKDSQALYKVSSIDEFIYYYNNRSLFNEDNMLYDFTTLREVICNGQY